MAEGGGQTSGKKGFATVLHKKVFRTKEKVLQNLGKADKTTDDVFDECVTNFAKQQVVANKLQKDLKNYIACVKTLSVASTSFSERIGETYETEWSGHQEITTAVEQLNILWDDYLLKLTDQVQNPLAGYINRFPDLQAKVAKRGRKLVDYDSARHNMESQVNAKKRDEAKITKAREELDEARRIYKDINNELHEELPAFYESRKNYLVSNINALYSTESKFQEESAKIKSQLVDSTDELLRESNQGFFSPKPYVGTRESILADDANVVNLTEDGSAHPSSLSTFYNVSIPNDHQQKERSSTSSADKKAPRVSIEESPPLTPDENHKEEMEFPTQNGLKDEPDLDKDTPTTPTDHAYEQVAVGGHTYEAVNVTPPLIEDGGVERRERKQNGADMNHKEPDTEDKKESLYSVASDTDDIYKVPKSNEPTVKLPDGVLYKVEATHPYNGEDLDELSFDPGDVVLVIPFEDAEDQDEGWLCGISETTGAKGVFPANFTKRI